jgi:hypothetical protein
MLTIEALLADALLAGLLLRVELLAQHVRLAVVLARGPRSVACKGGSRLQLQPDCQAVPSVQGSAYFARQCLLCQAGLQWRAT